MAKSTEKIDNHEDIRDDEIKDELNELMEEIDFNISLSEIGEYDSNGYFIIKEDIKGEDDKGNYIKIRGKKYYSSEGFSGDGIHLGYNIVSRNSGDDIIYIGNMSQNKLEGKGIKFFEGTKSVGEWKNNKLDGYGYRTLDANGRTFNGLWKEGSPVNGKLEQYKNGKISYTYEGGMNKTREFHGKGKIVYSDRENYEGDFINGKKDGQGKYIYSDGSFYEGGRKDGKKNGYGERTVKNQGQNNGVYKGDWKDGKLDCDNGVIDYNNGDSYRGTLIEGKRLDHIFQYRKELPNDKRGNARLPEGRCTLIINGEEHRISVKNGSISEESNSFITMFGDKKPNDDRSKQRGHIRIDIKPFDNSYRLESWDFMKTEWKLDGDYYKFKSNQGKIISIKKSISFGDNAAMHVANLINFCKNFKREHPGGDGFDYKGNTLQYDDKVQDLRTFLWDTDILDNVPKHFGGISAKELSEWLNSN